MRLVLGLFVTLVVLVAAPSSALAFENAVVSPPSHDFGNVDWEAPDPSRVFTLTNDGDAQLDFTTASITGADAAHYDLTFPTCMGATIPAGSGDSCTLTVTFDPQSTGSWDNAALEIETDDPDNAGITTVPLDGNSIDPDVELSDATLDLDSQLVGAGPTAAQTLTVHNTGTTALAPESVSITGADASMFHIVNRPTEIDDCANKAATDGFVNGHGSHPGDNCTLQITFDPTSSGTKSATLQIVTNAHDSPHQIALGGVGLQAGFTVDPASKDFGTVDTRLGATSQHTFTITNSGTSELTILSGGVTLSGANADQFTSFDASGCTTTGIAATEDCPIKIAYDPSTDGAHSATITIISNAPGSPHTIALSGTGATPPTSDRISSDPTLIEFGSHPVGAVTTARTLNFSYTGSELFTNDQRIGASLDVSVANETHFSRALVSCRRPLQDCTASLQFHPKATGQHATSIDMRIVYLGQTVAKHSIPVTGTGTSADGGGPTPGACSFTVAPGCATDDAITGTPNKDTLFGGEGKDTIKGLAGDDVIEGGTGDDVVEGGDGADTVTTGDGNDVVRIAGKAADMVDTGAGSDQVLYAGTALSTAKLGEGNDIATFGAVTPVTGTQKPGLIFGDGGNDTLTANGPGARFAGNAGADKLNVPNLKHLAKSTGLAGGIGNDIITIGNKTPLNTKFTKNQLKGAVIDCGAQTKDQLIVHRRGATIVVPGSRRTAPKPVTLELLGVKLVGCKQVTYK